MDKNKVFLQVQDIFRDILDKDDLTIAFETVADDVEGWDSLNHLQIIDAIQKHFKIKFTAKEMISWNNVDSLINSIINRL